MNKYKIMSGTIKSYLMLAKVTRSKVYLAAAKNCAERLKTMLEDEKTKTMEFKQ